MKYEFRKQFTVDGERFEIKAHTLEEFNEKYQKRIDAIHASQRVYNGDITVREWAMKCFATYRINASEQTLKASYGRYNKHIDPVIGVYPMKKVLPFHLQQILNDQKGKSKSHIEKLSQELFFIFDKAVDNQIISFNPAKNLTKPESIKKERRSITKKEREVLEELFQEPRFLCFAFMLYCGCRPSEVRELKWDDILESGDYTYLHIRGTKTANSDRLVPMCKEILDLVEKAPRMSVYVATTSTGHFHYQASWKRICHQLKRQMDIKMGAKLYRNEIIESVLADDFQPYLLRHTFCTDLQKKGVDVRSAQKLMGHADIKTTVNIYTHQDEETLLESAKLICG